MKKAINWPKKTYQITFRNEPCLSQKGFYLIQDKQRNFENSSSNAEIFKILGEFVQDINVNCFDVMKMHLNYY